MKSDLLPYLPLIAGALLWLVGGNLVLRRIMAREGLRWPAYPSLKSFKIGEIVALTFFFLAALAGFACTAALSDY
ncbi:hypothetical protein [Dyella koreensis]|uniref:Uncharacterized protein n=1 Tax=Dyella koreensis TaxID=311235 RepID=A0ABW8K4P2_9GAMM